MFDIGFYELVLIVVVALILWDSKDISRVLYNVGKLIKKIRRHTEGLRQHGHHMLQELELEEIKKTAFQNAKKRETHTKNH